MKRCFFCKQRIWFWQSQDITKEFHIDCHILHLKEFIKSIPDIKALTVFVQELTFIATNNPEYGILWKSVQVKNALLLSEIQSQIRNTTNDLLQVLKP